MQRQLASKMTFTQKKGGFCASPNPRLCKASGSPPKSLPLGGQEGLPGRHPLPLPATHLAPLRWWRWRSWRWPSAWSVGREAAVWAQCGGGGEPSSPWDRVCMAGAGGHDVIHPQSKERHRRHVGGG